jgi:glycosyltransferase involved in cell wall biosynthesis
LKIPGGTFVLLHVGSFRPEKNHIGLLEIVGHIVKSIDPAVLICVGDGHERPRIERAARERGLAANVRFEGTQLDVRRYMAAADVLVFPSRFEGFGNVLVESQDAELPIVASDIAAHREVVAPPQHRFLFSLPDYRKAAYLICAQWRALQASDNCWVSTSAAWVRDRFAFAHVAADWGRLYAECVCQP